MKPYAHLLALLLALAVLASCTGRHSHHYNTQRGAAIGAGVGALSGHLLGRDGKATLIGAGVGTLLGAVVGNAVDQQHQIAREADLSDKRIVYYDQNTDYAIEAIPGPRDQQTKCRKVTKREWDKGYLVSEKVEEICEGEKQTPTY
ncbi:MAG: glycine zipper domain-containing protein [Desulfobacterales bacterium]|nr:glycine zipper domain-containing protein [Desulfobacterales bacterium]